MRPLPPEPAGYPTFARYAYPPNELGYCGPTDVAGPDLGGHAREFDGAWPYLVEIAEAAGIEDPLDEEVVRTYWIGGRLLDAVDPDRLLARLRTAFTGQVTGLLGELTAAPAVLAHHSFHVLVVYPWIRFLERDPATPLQILQECRIRWGTVASVDDEYAVVTSPPLTYEAGVIGLGAPVTQTVRWRKHGAALAPAPAPGGVIAAHWDWICATLSESECADLQAATRITIELVNAVR